MSATREQTTMDRIIRLNGAEAPWAPDVAALIEAQGYGAGKGLAVAVNDSVVPRSAWGATPLAPGDAVEIVRAVGGG